MGRLADTLKVPRKKDDPASGFVSVFDALMLLASSRACRVRRRGGDEVVRQATPREHATLFE
jgi:hypothetical protein